MTDTDDFTWRGKRRPGRPRGSKNAHRIIPVEAAVASQDDATRVPDITEMISAQLRIIRSAQRQLEAGGNLRDITELSRALDSAVAAVARAARSQDDILARMSQSQQVEAAVRKVEEQDATTIAAVVRRLKDRLNAAAEALVAPRTAVDAMRDL